MKQKSAKITRESGFTLIELLVVLSIMVILSTVIVIDFNRQRVQRSRIIAKNEIVTNLRKVQGYTLSSRNISDNVPAKFYILTFRSGASNYTVEAVDSNYQFHGALETINLPNGVTFEALKIGTTSYNCIQVIFSSPFGKMYAHAASTCDSTIAATLQDPVLLSQVNQQTVNLYFYNHATVPQYVSLNPITGQITTR